MGIENDNSGGQEHDVDAILAQAYGHQNPTSEAPKETPAPAQQAPQEPQYREFEFNSRGQAVKIRENDPRFSQWLSQGHDYAQNINSFKSERQSWESERQNWEKQWSPYKEIDQFARQNPEWWAHVDQSFKERLSSQQGQIPPDAVRSYLDQQLQPLKEDLPLMKQFLQEMQTQKIEAQQKQEDDRLEEAIKSIQGKYKDLDFAAKDESGLSLEQRVINHAMEHGISTFKAAFNDYYQEHLEKIAEARGRESVMQEMQKRKKMGLLDDHPTPSSNRSSSVPFNAPKAKSWHDQSLSSEAILREFKFA